MSLSDRVAGVFEKVFDVEPERFTPEGVPEDVLRWDSLGHMNLVMGLEDAFDVHFEVDEIAELSSGAKILEILRAKGAQD